MSPASAADIPALGAGEQPRPPPSARQRARLLALAGPLLRAFAPHYYAFDRLPVARPLVFVGNHQLLALDTPLLVAELWRRGLPVRPLADDFLFALGLVARSVSRFGIVRADPEVASALLARGESLLVYPGGAREATMGKRQALDLAWWGRLGFARLALRHRVPIVPVAAVGVDDAVRVLVDRNGYLQGPMQRVVDALGVRHDLLPPVCLPRTWPRPAFKLGRPIAMEHLAGHDEASAVRRLRGEVATQLEAELQWLLAAERARRA